ncbi:transporter substrate-binding domain-containing protein [Sneathiella sp. P13V-1]|uniref:substrate-binding periplasmic protein n=1 Tax=Sneathiella sp. P13V-1 TaxID=2697366 RepID=UPI00187B2182|nr:transporter substrate-binding domain-containing protein [Sneathiella sp. P13V-1]MBE7637822.1 transporter substrate-binding domain-containing protein [Sneathiella sp. P13V-1]
MNYLRILSTVLVLLLPATVAADCLKVRISGPPLWPPFINQVDKAGREGPAFDFLIDFIQSEGLQAVVEDTKPWPRVLRDLEIGELDFVVAILKTEERERKYIYTDRWNVDRYGVVTLKDSQFEFSDLNNLSDKTGAFFRGVAFPPPYAAFIKSNKKLTGTSNVASLYSLLNKKRVNYLLVSVDSFLALLPKKQRETDYAIIESSVVNVPVYMAASKLSECKYLVPKLNTYIQSQLYSK